MQNEVKKNDEAGEAYVDFVRRIVEEDMKTGKWGGRVATRQQILDNVWGYEYYGDTRTLDVHIRRLRQKLGACGDCIETVVGVGYRFIGSAKVSDR